VRTAVCAAGASIVVADAAADAVGATAREAGAAPAAIGTFVDAWAVGAAGDAADAVLEVAGSDADGTFGAVDAGFNPDAAAGVTDGVEPELALATPGDLVVNATLGVAGTAFEATGDSRSAASSASTAGALAEAAATSRVIAAGSCDAGAS
jgi:hypothetical protein